MLITVSDRGLLQVLPQYNSTKVSSPGLMYAMLAHPTATHAAQRSCFLLLKFQMLQLTGPINVYSTIMSEGLGSIDWVTGILPNPVHRG